MSEREFCISFDVPNEYTVELGGNGGAEIINQEKSFLEVKLVSNHVKYGSFTVKDSKNNTLFSVMNWVDFEGYVASFSDSDKSYTDSYSSEQYDYYYDSASNKSIIKVKKATSGIVN